MNRKKKKFDIKKKHCAAASRQACHIGFSCLIGDSHAGLSRTHTHTHMYIFYDVYDGITKLNNGLTAQFFNAAKSNWTVFP